MADNALRCIESDYPALLQLAQELGVIVVENGNVIPEKDVAWTFLGYKRDHLDESKFVSDENGNKYVHSNVRTPYSVGERVAQFATDHPDIAAAMGDVSRFFVVDENGNPIDPKFPMAVYL